MIKNRIRELRKSANLSQEALSVAIGTTQQAISRMENYAYAVPSDLLIEISDFFNVTTDYILGVSDIKRDQNMEKRMNLELDKCYDFVLRYKRLSEINKKTLLCVLERLEQAQMESIEAPYKGSEKNVADGNM